MSDFLVPRSLVSEMAGILRSYRQNPRNMAGVKRYFQVCLAIINAYSPGASENIVREVVALQAAAPGIVSDGDLYILIIMRQAFTYYGEPLPEDSFLDLHHRAMASLPPAETDELALTIPTHILYEKVAMAVATGRRGSFDVPDNAKWPTHHIDENSLKANILVRPSHNMPVGLLEASPQYSSLLKLMNDRVDRMDELTMDVMHIICARWLESNPLTHTEQIRLTADDILEARGVQRHLNGEGKRYGYTQEQRASIQERMAALSCIWISVDDMTVTIREGGRRSRKSTRYESPALVITGRFGEVDEEGGVELWTWNVRPGDVFSTFLLNPVSREVGFFPKQSLLYDPKYQSWEKRLSFYLSWQIRVRRHREGQAFIYKTGTLLEAIHETTDTAHPSRTRERLETTLDTLQQDGLIQGWQYTKDCEENTLPPRKWVGIWLEWKIRIHPAGEIFTSEQMSFFTPAPTSGLPEPPGGQGAAAVTKETLKRLRVRDNLTQQKAAEKLGVARSLISQIEAGKRNITPILATKILRWEANITE